MNVRKLELTDNGAERRVGLTRSSFFGNRLFSEGRVALSTRSGERGDADGPAQGDRTADFGAAHGGLAAVSRVAQGEPGSLHAAANHAAVDLQTRCGDPVIAPLHLPIEPGQLTLAEHVHQTGPRCLVERMGPGRARFI